MFKFACLVLIVSGALVCCQEYGQVPPRPQQFAGVDQSRLNFRQRFINPRIAETGQSVDQPQIIRSRRPHHFRKSNPLLLQQQQQQQQSLDQAKTNVVDDVPVSVQFGNPIGPTPAPQFQHLTTRGQTPRPVQEEINEENGQTTSGLPTPSTPAFTPSLRTSFPPTPDPVSLAQAPEEFQKTQFLQPTAFRPSPFQSAPPSPVQGPEERHSIRQQQNRPVQQPILPTARTPSRSFSPPQPASETPVQQDYYRQVPNRPPRKQEPARQQFVDREQFRQYPGRQAEVVRSDKGQEYATRPVQRESHVKAPLRERKPVSQTIRKYHEERDDGTIVWGYENDDGSFKEETIGIDCVTRGKYGYVDPDGVKREYAYQTGIPCVKPEENEAAASDLGYVDYTDNKYVLPNGDEIDLDAMVKNRARKPVQQFRIRS